MALSESKTNAYKVLELEEDASPEQIRTAYKKLALLWHPDKHNNSEVATKKFQEISSAYKCLTSDDEEEVVTISFEEMFDLFDLLFSARYFTRQCYCNDSSEEDFSYIGLHSNNQRAYTPKRTRKGNTKNYNTSKLYKPSESEAKLNGDALIKEEERLKLQQETKRERRRRKKQKKREEKENLSRSSTSFARDSDSDPGRETDSEEEREQQQLGDGKVGEKLKYENENKFSNNKQNGEARPLSNSNNTMPNSQANKKASENKKQDAPNLKSGSSKNANKKFTPGDVTQNGTVSSSKAKSKHKNSEKKNKDDLNISGDDEATQGLDLSSAFFAGTVSSVNKKLASQKKNKKGGNNKSGEPEVVESSESKIKRSRQLAIRGNEMATAGNYQGAIDLFTQAIGLDSTDHRFFGNRSYCFDQKVLYERALKDAEKAISLAKDWPKGYFRKGRALAGLKQFSEAESAYELVLKLDPGCEEAVQELKRVRVCRLMDMGFTRSQSEIAVIKHGSVHGATEALLSGALDANSMQELAEEVYISDDEDLITQTIELAKLDTRNPERLRSIWIGNLSQSASEKQIRDLFGKYGEIESMRRLTEKYCAFINYRDSSMASKAMANLTGYLFCGSQLKIKFPDNPITDGHLQTIYLKKSKPGDVPSQSQPQWPSTTPPQQQEESRGQPSQQQKQQPQKQQPQKQQPQKPPQQQQPPQQQPPQQQQQQQQKWPQPQQWQSQPSSKTSADSTLLDGGSGGPVNGDECYFWRTTGCWYGDRCRYKHLPTSKGSDLKPWHK